MIEIRERERRKKDNLSLYRKCACKSSPVYILGNRQLDQQVYFTNKRLCLKYYCAGEASGCVEGLFLSHLLRPWWLTMLKWLFSDKEALE
jgi:hypothetical protein